MPNDLHQFGTTKVIAFHDGNKMLSDEHIADRLSILCYFQFDSLVLFPFFMLLQLHLSHLLLHSAQFRANAKSANVRGSLVSLLVSSFIT